MKRHHKYSAVATTVDGIRFHSKAEAKYYAGLKLREKAGEIHDLVLQPAYDLDIPSFPNGVELTRCGKYVGDFVYWDVARSRSVHVDVKGYDTPLSKLKRKIVEALYGIEIEIVR